MEYSKAELEELIDSAEVSLDFIKNTGNGKGLMEKIKEEIPYLTAETQFMSNMYITVYLDWLSQRLLTIKNCIYATDDISLANETYNLVSTVWKEYVSIEDFHKPYNSKEHERSITSTLDSIKRKIDRYNKAHPEQRQTPTKSKPRKKVPHDYFKCAYTQAKVCGIFKRLKEEKYIDSNTEINNWILACGIQSNDSTPFKPIKWLAQLNELVYLIDMLFPSCRWRWKAAEHCFIIDGNPPDNGAMRTESSKMTITSEKYYKLDKVLEIN